MSAPSSEFYECENCGHRYRGTAAECPSCGVQPPEPSISPTLDDTPALLEPGDDPILPMAVAGLVAAACGACVWATIVYLTGAELAYVAWALGGVVGFSVATASKQRGQRAARVAALMVVLALLAGKVFGAQWSVAAAYAEEIQKDDAVIQDAILLEMVNEGFVTRENLPAVFDALAAGERPTELELVWTELESRTVYISPQRRQALATAFAQEVVSSRGIIDLLPFMFSIYDIVWAFLAIFTAVQVATWTRPTPSRG